MQEKRRQQAAQDERDTADIVASEFARAQKKAAEEAREAARRAEEYDSYCMSEPEEQEQDDYSDDEDAARARAGKYRPAWAERDAIRAALHAQCEEKVDPDTIFFECNTCNLEEIFQRQSSRYVFFLPATVLSRVWSPHLVSVL